VGKSIGQCFQRESPDSPLAVAVCSLISILQEFIRGLSSTITVISKNVRQFVQQLLKMAS